MAMNARDYFSLLSVVRDTPEGQVWSSYDAEADVLYVNFTRPAVADDSELTDDDVIVRFHGEDIIGFTILHASKREGTQS